MNQSRYSKLFILTCGLMSMLSAVAIISYLTLSIEARSFLWPALATVFVLGVFSVGLKGMVGGYLLGELGFVYMGLAVVYTLIPALTFMSDDLDPVNPLSWLSPTQADLAAHLWRHVLFIVGIAVGYLVMRGRKQVRPSSKEIIAGRYDTRTVILLLGVAVTCIVLTILMSAPAETYWDNYIRYDHLSWWARKLVSVCLRLKLGVYTVLLVFFFRNYRKYKLVIPFFVCVICVHDLIYSRGSRIESFVILLQVGALYHYTVRPIAIKMLILCIPATMLFSMIEVIRIQGPETKTISELGLPVFRFPLEFGSVYYTGFHLYGQRAQGIMAPAEWPMFFNDFISIFTFGSFDRWSPMVWYMKNYFPAEVVPPFMLGPIADSAVWGGEVDLLIRGLVSGAFFAYLVRWFVRHKETWWGMAIYVYCYATCILTLKHGIFFHLTPLFKTLLPVLLLVAVARSLRLPKQSGGGRVREAVGRLGAAPRQDC